MFFYYHDLEEASRFYGEVLKLDLELDREWAKIYRIGEDSHVGLVDARRGSHKPSHEKPVRLQIMVHDADAWYSYLKEQGVYIERDSPKVGKELHIKAFTIHDPEEYAVEICEYISHYGEANREP